jgi:hypothetical protein
MFPKLLSFMSNISKRYSFIIPNLLFDSLAGLYLRFGRGLHLTESPIRINPTFEMLILLQILANLKSKIMFPIPEQNLQQYLITQQLQLLESNIPKLRLKDM